MINNLVMEIEKDKGDNYVYEYDGATSPMH